MALVIGVMNLAAAEGLWNANALGSVGCHSSSVNEKSVGHARGKLIFRKKKQHKPGLSCFGGAE